MKYIDVYIKIKQPLGRYKKKMVPGYTIPKLPEFVVTNSNGKWTITHILSGGNIAAYYKSITAAKKAAQKYLCETDWNKPYKDWKKDQMIMEKVENLYKDNRKNNYINW